MSQAGPDPGDGVEVSEHVSSPLIAAGAAGGAIIARPDAPGSSCYGSAVPATLQAPNFENKTAPQH